MLRLSTRPSRTSSRVMSFEIRRIKINDDLKKHFVFACTNKMSVPASIAPQVLSETQALQAEIMYGDLTEIDKTILETHKTLLREKLNNLTATMKQVLKTMQASIDTRAQSVLGESIQLASILKGREEYIRDNPYKWCSPDNEFFTWIQDLKNCLINVDESTQRSLSSQLSTAKKQEKFNQWGNIIKYVVPGKFDINIMSDWHQLYPMLLSLYTTVKEILEIICYPHFDYRKVLQRYISRAHHDIINMIEDGADKVYKYCVRFVPDMYMKQLGYNDYTFDLLDFYRFCSSIAPENSDTIRKIAALYDATKEIGASSNTLYGDGFRRNMKKLLETTADIIDEEKK